MTFIYVFLRRVDNINLLRINISWCTDKCVSRYMGIIVDTKSLGQSKISNLSL